MPNPLLTMESSQIHQISMRTEPNTSIVYFFLLHSQIVTDGESRYAVIAHWRKFCPVTVTVTSYRKHFLKVALLQGECMGWYLWVEDRERFHLTNVYVEKRAQDFGCGGRRDTLAQCGMRRSLDLLLTIYLLLLPNFNVTTKVARREN